MKRNKEIQNEDGVDMLSECPHCFCSTKITKDGRCGKCNGYKAKVGTTTSDTPTHNQ